MQRNNIWKYVTLLASKHQRKTVSSLVCCPAFILAWLALFSLQHLFELMEVKRAGETWQSIGRRPECGGSCQRVGRARGHCWVPVARAAPHSEVIFLLMCHPGNYSVEVLTQRRELTSCSLAGIPSRWIIVLCASANKECDLKSYQLMFPCGPTPRSLCWEKLAS